MPENEKVASEEEKPLERRDPHTIEPTTSERRRQFAKIFGWIGLAAFALWGFSLFKNHKPIDVQIHYLYEGIPHANQIDEVIARLWTSDKRLQARVVYFHKGRLPRYPRNIRRIQKLKLLGDDYRLEVEVWYHDGSKRTLSRQFPLHDDGKIFVHLKRAR